MTRLQKPLLTLTLLLMSACATLTPAQRDRAQQVAHDAQSQQIDCQQADACAQASPLHELSARAFAESSAEQPRHYALLIDRGTDALLARINLIRSATTSIDLQTYIFDEDDAGRLVLDELLQAARRGVHVRVLMDQLSALREVDTMAALTGAHRNFEVRLYNPLLKRARISYPQYLVAAACCWHRLNQRMHNKLLLIDAAVGITGGRNYQDDYYDWDATYNFRDRDVLVAGPVARQMGEHFGTFWEDRRSVPAARLTDVGRRLLKVGVPPLPDGAFERPERADAMRHDAGDSALVRERLATQALPVGVVRYIADAPAKHRDDHARGPSTESLRSLIESAQSEVLLQTPYLVLSDPAQEMFRDLHRRPSPPRVIVSTNSLAATDAFIAYALSYKYKRRYLREFGFDIYEYKPFPADAPVDLGATGARYEGQAPRLSPRAPRPRVAAYFSGSVVEPRGYRDALAREHIALRYSTRRANEPVPLKRAGVRIGLHAKSLVIDERIGVVGTHNFDPRGDHYNTESSVVIEDPAFARALADSIRRDISPANAWTIARRDKPAVLSGLDYSVGKAFEQLPLFDLWPMRYATSYEFQPGLDCPLPLSRDHPQFRQCYRPVGYFPEVRFGSKRVLTRIFTAFGAGLAPIL